ncbi:MAG: hypothetical protein Q4P13_05945 [Psychrobacter sp.]|nr:hypothetical protein [Psychrobacter sp.]
MATLTVTGALQEIRKAATELGMTLRRQKAYVNNKQAYLLVDKYTDKVLDKNLTVWSAYENMQNGYFAMLAYQNGCIPPAVIEMVKVLNKMAKRKSCPSIERNEAFIKAATSEINSNLKGVNVIKNPNDKKNFNEALDYFFKK